MGRVLRMSAFTIALVTMGLQAFAGGRNEPVVHERIPSDPREDLALHVALDGDLPAAIQTPAGIVAAPDPLRPPTPWELTYGPSGEDDAFVPDRDTKRPEVSDYDDPFTPSTAPFKRLEAFDAVRDDYRLAVRDPRLVRLNTQTGAALGKDEDPFYADVVVELPPEGSVRIPSVGPGARILRARLGVGVTDMPFRIMRDGADNWFLQPTRSTASRAAAVRARLVMELSIPRAAFGGALGDPSWSELPAVSPLPDSIAREAAAVRNAIGVSRAMRPREAIAKLVDYFRGFVDSSDPPQGLGSVYLDLALSRKGVCRHRAFAFLITAQSLGVPTRLVENEAHAWVEIHDGALWRRIDLGGAGRMATRTSNRLATRSAYEAPREAFPWPQSSERGSDMIGAAPATGSAASSPGTPPATSDSATPSSVSRAAQGSDRSDDDPRPRSTIVLTVADPVAHRGIPIHVHGSVGADRAPCAHVAVEFWLREPKGVQDPDERARQRFAAGTLATSADGTFDGVIAPISVRLGDYDLVAETPGNSVCGPGTN